MNPVEKYLRSRIGLNAESIGPTAIERVTRLRMKALGLKKQEDYYELLETSAGERDELIESVVVNETWFFRDHNAFAAFAKLAQEWFSQNPTATLRILSVPCSSGEEPYSLAMCLLDAGLTPERFTIDAADISTRSLARAARGVFGKNSFRGKDLKFRDRHFHHTKEGYALNESVRGCVRFQKDNLLNEDFLAGHGPYDFIFCRNVLIYFAPATQKKVLDILQRKMAATGIVFVGPAELSVFLDNGFASLNLSMAFACRKAIASAASATAAQNVHSKKVSTAPKPGHSTFAHKRTTQRLSPEDGQPKSVNLPPSRQVVTTRVLDDARKLADEGKLKQAAEICETHLNTEGPSVQAYYLLGLVHDAGGDPKAAEYYRKVLYLEPNHYEALWHMALLLKKNGSDTEARAFERRAERAQKKTDNS